MRNRVVSTACVGAALGLLVLALAAWWLVPTKSSGDALPLALWLAAGIIGAGVWSWWRDGDRDGMGAELSIAVAAPLCVLALIGSSEPALVAIGMVIATLALVPWALSLASVPGGSLARWTARLVVGGSVIVALALSVGSAVLWEPRGGDSFGLASLRWGALSAALLLVATLASVAVLRSESLSGLERISTSVGLGGAAIATIATGSVLVMPLPWWTELARPGLAVIGTVAVLGIVAIRPLQREAEAAMAERDLVVAASDAERLRMATALHDGPLGDLALLVQRLDMTGDAQNAGLARTISSELRQLGNELRVPILDDLGAGPAIEWLADRVSSRSMVPVSVDIVSGERPPAEVEDAAYRIAQEAVTNAVKHGRGPVRVVYRSVAESVTLVVADRGPGFASDAPVRVARPGHLGMRLMKLRAESVGARFVLKNQDGGGAEVGFSWTAATP